MSDEYAGVIYATQTQAARASVSDYLYAGGNNSEQTVAEMDVEQVSAELIDLMRRDEWQVPGYDGNNADDRLLVREMVRHVIGEAHENAFRAD